MPFKIKNIPALDGLRGIAVLFVVFYHCLVKNFFYGGFIGVDIFFVISGFLITSILLKEWNKNNCIDLKAFYLRRARRLLPALIMMLAVFTIVGFAFSASPQDFIRDSLWALSYVANWAQIYSANGPDLLGHTWSLSIEEQFYFIWPLLLITFLKLVYSRKKLFFIISSLAIASAVLRLAMQLSGSTVHRLYFGLDTRADSILIGCAVAFLCQLVKDHIDEKRIYLLQHVALAAAGGLLILAIYARHYDINMLRYGYLMTALLSAIVIFYLPFSKGGLLISILNNTLLIRIVKISYGIYLWHYPLLRMLQDYYHVHGIMTVICGVPLSLLVATLSFWIIEKPFLAKKSIIFNSERSPVF